MTQSNSRGRIADKLQRGKLSVTPFRLIVAGGRDFTDYALLCKKLDHLLSNISRERGIIIVHGDCETGADRMGERYAIERGYHYERYPAEWKLHGLKAGPLRNQFMANIGSGLVAFWDGKSRGTADMIRRAKAKGIPVRVVRY